MSYPVSVRYEPPVMSAADVALHAEVSADGRQIVLIGTGSDTAIADMAARLKLATPLIQASKPPGALLLALTWPAVVQLSTMFGPLWRPGPRLTAWIGQQLTARMPTGGALSITLPEGRVPRPYQVDGALMLAATGRGFLFDDPGVGKTITTILALAQRAANGETVLPVVVIAPSSVVDPWVQACRDWMPAWRTIAWRGSPERRGKLTGTADVYVASYGTATSDALSDKGRLVRLAPRSVVVDECHLIKSHDAQRSRAARRLARKADNFVALSGTPITHHPGDLWPALEALAPTAWPSRERYITRYCQTVQGDYKETILGLAPHNEPEFRTSLLGQHRRVSKADVLPQLPPKVYSVRQVELPADYRKAYDDMEKDMCAALPDGGELSVMSVLAQLTRLSQLASAAADVSSTFEPGPDGLLKEHVSVKLKAPSWKVDALLEVLAERPGEPVVAFAPSRQLMMLAGAAAEAAGLSVGYVVGGQQPAERTQTVEHFQAGKLDLLCATTGAGGVGLTLTAARTVAFLQRPWSIVEAMQAEDRCHRIGSEIHTSIEVIDIIAADTIDTRVRTALQGKAQQLSDLLQDPRIVTELLGGISVRNKRKAA